jgi:restriction system protein
VQLVIAWQGAGPQVFSQRRHLYHRTNLVPWGEEMGRRRRYYSSYRTDVTPTPPAPVPLYPDYRELFKAATVPPPPPVAFIPFDANMIHGDADARSLELESLRDTLVYSTTRDPRIQFSAYEQTYPDAPAVASPPPPETRTANLLPEPQLPRTPELSDFLPKRNWLTSRVPLLHALYCALAGPSAQAKLKQAIAAHNGACTLAEAELTRIRNFNAWENEHLQTYNEARAQWESLHEQWSNQNAQTLTAWEEAKLQFLAMQAADLASLAQLKKGYLERDPSAIALHTQLVLRRSPYPSLFPRSIDAAYDPNNRIVVVDYQLPDIEAIPIVKQRERRASFDRVPINAAERRQISDDLLYMIMLRPLREIVVADEADAFSAVVINGWMSFKDKATGQQRSEYLMSIYAKAEQVRAIDFANVDPKTCFRSLKGVSAPRPTQCVPVAPLMQFNKDDRRIIAGRQVIDGLASESNLAVMPWDDFEHLIRELFEKEFAHNGAEVRVTQASHDRGVDALIFDPDPVRGGKYVVQAKRYTATVDVSSVRDLYGTVLNEGANRGILVCTSAYEPDAYEFAKDKPITLIDGPRLLHMLEKHGYSFRIDLKEARRLLLQ